MYQCMLTDKNLLHSNYLKGAQSIFFNQRADASGETPIIQMFLKTKLSEDVTEKNC